MKTVNEIFIYDKEIKKSTFISFLTPYGEFDSLKESLKIKHPKARHIVWAKRYLNSHNQIVENSSDDGEPKGTSGPPVLNVMRGEELIECGILIVRYFGGTKLGTGGLVRAYGGGAKGVIAKGEFEEYLQKESFSFFITFSMNSRIEYFIKREGLDVIKKEYEVDGTLWYLNLTLEQKSIFLEFASKNSILL